MLRIRSLSKFGVGPMNNLVGRVTIPLRRRDSNRSRSDFGTPELSWISVRRMNSIHDSCIVEKYKVLESGLLPKKPFHSQVQRKMILFGQTIQRKGQNRRSVLWKLNVEMVDKVISCEAETYNNLHDKCFWGHGSECLLTAASPSSFWSSISRECMQVPKTWPDVRDHFSSLSLQLSSPPLFY